MQNTTTSNQIPTKLMENFFIAGMSQQTLFRYKKDGQLLNSQNPEILFSMYAKNKDQERYVQFIFPSKINISTNASIEPKFHTFEITEQDLSQSFFHCFIFHEELSENQLRTGNIDQVSERGSEATKDTQNQSDDDEEGDFAQKNQQNKNLKRDERLTSTNVIRQSYITGGRQKSAISNQGGGFADKVMEMTGQQMHSIVQNHGDQAALQKNQPASPKFITEEEAKVVFDKENDFDEIPLPNLRINQSLPSEVSNNKVYIPVALVIQTKSEFHDAFKQILKRIYEGIKCPPKPSTNLLNYLQNLNQYQEEKLYLPAPKLGLAFAEVISNIAFLRTIPAPVFNSEINIFFMGTMINLKENAFNKIPHKNLDAIRILTETLDFKSIIMCLEALLFDKNLIVFATETSLLFNIVEGVKQLMFPFTVDFTMLLPANDEYTDGSGRTLKDIFREFDGMQPAIFAIKTPTDPQELDYDYDHDPDDEDHYIPKGFYQYRNAVIVDVDASYVLESKYQDDDGIPEFPNQIFILKVLNRLKNPMMDNYDKVYPERVFQKDICTENQRIQQIREIFFNELIPYLKPAYLAIKPNIEEPQNLYDYWDDDAYINFICTNSSEELEEKKKKFAERLKESRAFVKFVDGYLEDDICNFDLVNSILCKKNLLKKRYKYRKSTLKKYDEQIKTQLQNLSNEQQKQVLKKYDEEPTELYRFNDEVTVFNFLLPDNSDKKILFEKIYFMSNSKDEKNQMRKDLLTKLIKGAYDQENGRLTINYDKRKSETNQSFLLSVSDASKENKKGKRKLTQTKSAILGPSDNKELQNEESSDEMSSSRFDISRKSEVTDSIPQQQSTIYGMRGLLDFLQTLFQDSNEKERQKLNFYFSIKKRINEYLMAKHKENLETSQMNRHSVLDILKQQQSFGKIQQKQHKDKKENCVCHRNRMKTIMFQKQKTGQIHDIYTNNKDFILQKAEESSDEDDLDELQNFSKKDGNWFWIEKGEENDHTNNLFLSITYQETEFFTKLLRNFEIKTDQSLLIFNLITNYPLIWWRIPKELFPGQEIKYRVCQYPNNNNLSPITSLESEINEYGEQINADIKQYYQSSYDILEYMFPIQQLELTISNMTRQQIKSFYKKSLQDVRSTDVQRRISQNQQIDVFQHDILMEIPIDHSTDVLICDKNNLQKKEDLGIPIYRDLLIMLLHNKYLEIEKEKHLEKTNQYEKLREIIEQEAESISDKIDEKIFGLYSTKAQDYLLKVQKEKEEEQKKQEQYLQIESGYQTQRVRHDTNQRFRITSPKSRSRPTSAAKKKLSQVLKIFAHEKPQIRREESFEIIDSQALNKLNSTQEINKKQLSFEERADSWRQTSVAQRINCSLVIQDEKNPINESLILLKSVLSFWEADFNRDILNKGEVVYGNYFQKFKQERIQKIKDPKLLQLLERFKRMRPIFDFQESDLNIGLNMDKIEIQEYKKQSFYLNIYNALILYKLAELAAFNASKLFGIKNHQSWRALEQNATISIFNTEFTAFDIKHKIILNQENKPPGAFAVDRNYLHKQILFGFFLPLQHSLNLEDLIFNIPRLKLEFVKIVRLHIEKGIKAKEDFQLVILPAILKCQELKISNDQILENVGQLVQSQAKLMQSLIQKGDYVIEFTSTNHQIEKTKLSLQVIKNAKSQCKMLLPKVKKNQ